MKKYMSAATITHAREMMMMTDSGVLEVDRINHAGMNAGEMAHDDPNSVLLEPGKTAEVLWRFAGDAVLEISCNVPRHREIAMLEAINIVKPEPGSKTKIGSRRDRVRGHLSTHTIY